MKDKKLFEEALYTLDRIPCQFWACDGPTLRPVHMLTCARCSTVALLSKRLGCYVPRAKRTKETSDAPVGGWYRGPLNV